MELSVHRRGELALQKKDNCGMINKKKRIRIDTMNRNTIISLSMLYALWQTERKDLLIHGSYP